VDPQTWISRNPSDDTDNSNDNQSSNNDSQPSHKSTIIQQLEDYIKEVEQNEARELLNRTIEAIKKRLSNMLGG